ncbi:MAG: hypothetical protein ACTHKT_12720 [Solirubrobacterales bacterium]
MPPANFQRVVHSRSDRFQRQQRPGQQFVRDPHFADAFLEGGRERVQVCVGPGDVEVERVLRRPRRSVAQGVAGWFAKAW